MLRVASRLHFYVPVVIFLALWEAASRLGLIDQSVLPSFSEVLVGFVRLVTVNHLLQHAEITLYREMSGYLLAAGVGIVAGILMATSAWARFAIEPIINEGTEKIFLDKDGYTYRTKDRRRSAHFEVTVAITEKGCEVLTR